MLDVMALLGDLHAFLCTYVEDWMQKRNGHQYQQKWPRLREKQWKRRNYVKVGCKEACKCATTVSRLKQLM